MNLLLNSGSKCAFGFSCVEHKQCALHPLVKNMWLLSVYQFCTSPDVVPFQIPWFATKNCPPHSRPAFYWTD